MAAKTTEDSCSICLDVTSDNCDRTVVRLRCSHVFHLDCIGSAFNASGVMQCPNCRQYENGTWRFFQNSSLEEIIHEEAVDDDDDDDGEVQRFNPRRRYENRYSIVHGRIRSVQSHRRQGIDNHRFEPLMHTEVSPTHVTHYCYLNPLPLRIMECTGTSANFIRDNHPTIASASSRDEANMEPVCPLFANFQGNSSPTPMIASVASGSSSNDVLGSESNGLVDSLIGLSRSGRNDPDYYDFLLTQPSSSSLSPEALLASMATARNREFTGFLGNEEANSLPVAHETRYSFHASASEQTNDLFHERHTVSTSERTRNPINMAFMNITSENEPQVAIDPPDALEEIDDIATSEYLLNK